MCMELATAKSQIFRTHMTDAVGRKDGKDVRKRIKCHNAAQTSVSNAEKGTQIPHLSCTSSHAGPVGSQFGVIQEEKCETKHIALNPQS